ncbi:MULTISPECIES: phosphatidate cytidylyltransferase [Paenibacillus]|uniref:phosphatidate cytidylyltransferase n=1 Tax=Paenibacillus TaxID=44249 RepID=UPI0020407AAD|nr:phosphatidate cytidylyltransferase [Paenibacillus camelliae]MCM3632002.1 phosphatidate cytidylyltransferase [Paenibacillus camelliae]
MKQRLVTGVLAGALFLGLMILGGHYYAALIIVMAIIAMFEFSRMNHLSWNNPLHIAALLGLLALVIPFESYGVSWIQDTAIIWLLMFVLLALTVLTKNKVTINEAALTFLGTVYLGIGFAAMIDVRLMEEYALWWSFIAFCSIWASDIGAYFFGRAFGKRKLWPLISPNKTIEGAIGGIISSIIVAILFAVIAPDFIELWRAIVLGLVAAIAGQLGDLMQSAYKRVRGIKDMSNLLPGHGGIIDRTDSWIIVFPILVLTQLIPV